MSLTIIGYYLYDKDLSNVSDSTSHVAMGGIALGYVLTNLFSLNIIWTNIIMFTTVLLFVNLGEYFHNFKQVKYSSILSMQTSISAAIIALIFSLKIKIGIDLHGFLFGNINLLAWNDVLILGIMVTAFVIFYMLNWKKILIISLSRTEALTRGIKINVINHLMMSFIGITIIILVQFLGAFLITSLISIPVITSNIISKNYKDKYLNLFMLILFSMISGYFIANQFNLSISSLMVIMELTLLIIAYTYKKLLKK